MLGNKKNTDTRIWDPAFLSSLPQKEKIEAANTVLPHSVSIQKYRDVFITLSIICDGAFWENQPLTIFAKSSMLVAWQGSQYACKFILTR